MDLAVPSTPRWRTVANVVALSLGLNLWLAIIVLPAVFVTSEASSIKIVAMTTPLIALVLGLVRRSEAILLFGYPTALLLPVSLDPELVSAETYTAFHFTFVALGFVGYLFGVSALVSPHDLQPVRGLRPLHSSISPSPQAWLRRERMYRYLTILSIMIPLALLHAINFDSTTGEFIRKMYPGRSSAFAAVMNLSLLGFWLVVYDRVVLGALAVHRRGDQKLTSAITSMRATAAASRPRPILYISAVVAILLMIALVVARRGGLTP